MKINKLYLVALAIFISTTLLMFWSQIDGDSYFWEDFIEQVYPLQNFSAVESSNGDTPFWNPYTFSGMPFIADPQVGYYYPLNRLMTLFVNDGQLPAYIVMFIIILHFLIAQITLFLLARYFKISIWGSIISAIGYSFSMLFIAHVFHPMMLYHFAWFPLAFMLFARALKERKIYYGLWSSLVLAIIFFSGHPQTTLYLVLFLFLYFVWDFVASFKNKEFVEKKHLLHYIMAAGAAIIFAAGIYMVQYMQTQEMFELADRKEISYEKSAEGSLEVKQLFQMVSPKIFGEVNGANDTDIPFALIDGEKQLPYYYYWDTAYYFGIVILLLGLVGIVALFKQRFIAFLLFISLFGIAYALGDNFFLHRIFDSLPMFGSFRMPARIMIFAVLGFSLLAGFGFDFLAGEGDSKNKIKKLLIASILPLLVSILAVSGVLAEMVGVLPKFADKVSSASIGGFVILIITIVLAFMLAKNRKLIIIAGLGFAILTFIDLYSTGNTFNQSKTNPQEAYRLDAQTLQNFKATPPTDIFRINTRIPKLGVMTMKRNQGMVSRIMMIEGYNPLYLKRRMPPVKDISYAYDILNVRYEVVADMQKRTVNYVKKETALPHFWLCRNAEVLSSEEMQKKMDSKEVNLLKTALLEENPEITLSNKNENLGSVKCLEYSSNYMKCKTNSYDNSIMMFNEIWYPAWKIYINGKEAKLLRANWSLRAVALPKGEHIVEMKFESTAYAKGSIISIISLILVILGLAHFKYWERKLKTKNKKTI